MAVDIFAKYGTRPSESVYVFLLHLLRDLVVQMDRSISQTLFISQHFSKFGFNGYNLVWIKRENIVGQTYLSIWGNFRPAGKLWTASSSATVTDIE